MIYGSVGRDGSVLNPLIYKKIYLFPHILCGKQPYQEYQDYHRKDRLPPLST